MNVAQYRSLPPERRQAIAEWAATALPDSWTNAAVVTRVGKGKLAVRLFLKNDAGQHFFDRPNGRVAQQVGLFQVDDNAIPPEVR